MSDALQNAYPNFRVDQPLNPDDSRLCPRLFGDFKERVAQTLLLNKDSNYKLLLSGHTGCGKSTFLNFLVDDDRIKQAFFVVQYGIKQVLNPEDMTHVDLLLSMATQALQEAQSAGLKPSPRLLNKAKDLYVTLTGAKERAIETEQTTTRSTGAKVTAKIGFKAIADWFQAEFTESYKVDRAVRQVTREIYHGRVKDLIEVVNTLVEQIETTDGRRVLFVIDETDKVTPATAQNIFNENGFELAAPLCSAVFTINMDVACSSQYRVIQQKFSDGEFFPAMKLCEPDGTLSDATRENSSVLRELVLKRIGESLVKEDALDDAVRLSGGIVRELIRLMNYAIRNALLTKSSVVTAQDIKSAGNRLARDYNLNQTHLDILQKVLDDPLWAPTEEEDVDQQDSPLAVLINAVALIEYTNGERWRRPFPVLLPTLEKRRTRK